MSSAFELIDFGARITSLDGRGGRCWNYKVMGSQRSYLKGSINNRDDADDEY